MGKEKISKIGICLIGVLCCLLLLPIRGKAEGSATVRVGFFRQDGYHTIDEAGRHSGYDYEYLKKIADYTGWEFEFVEGTQEECLERLKSGEIDLLSNVERNNRREKEMYFPSVATICAANCLLEPEYRKNYAYEDFNSFNGMRVGMLKGSQVPGEFREYSQIKKFDYSRKMYDTEEEMEDALRRGEIDCVCMGSHRDLSNYRVLAYFGYTQRYYAISRKRPDMIDKLDHALQEIWVKEPEFEKQLYAKYFESSQRVAFTIAEQEYIAESKPIPVALYTDIGKLLCRYDEERQEYVGLMIDVLRLVSKRTGLRFTYFELPEGEKPEQYLQEHPDTIVAPALLNSLIGYNDVFQYAAPIIRGKMLTVMKANRQLSLEDAVTVAVPEGLYMAKNQLQEVFPNAQFISGGTHRGGLELVANGRADMALVNEITAAYQLQSPFFENLETVELIDITEDQTFGLSLDADPLLLSILNKAIASFSERDIRQMVVDNTAATSYVMTTQERLYEGRYILLIGLLLLSGFIGFIELRNSYNKRKTEYKHQLHLSEEHLKVEQKYREKLFYKANYDELTGLYNGSYFIQKANERMEQNPDKVYSFMHINLINFKMLNDLYGIEAGDAVLKSIADQMRKRVGKNGIYGRMYADQFIVCMEIENEVLESRVRRESVRYMTHNGQKIQYRLNVGVYVDWRHCGDAGKALEYAQIALSNDKGTGDTAVSYFQDEDLNLMRMKQRITNEMETALAEEQFYVYLQPQYDVTGRTVVGAEALVRWFHPEHGMISPAVFIPVFEQNRFIYRLDSYMCDKVCALLAEWLARGKAVPVSVNLSQIDMENPNLVPMLKETLERHQVPIEYLHLEITESAYVEDRRLAKHVIEHLRELGFYIEMDDFGSGYSSLNMLKDIPVDVLKMDMKFLEGETHMDRGGNIISSVVQMAHSMGILVVAEGVETEREAKFLQSIGCNFVQGYLYGRPISADEFTRKLRECAVGEKRINFKTDESKDKLYWKMEMYEILLKKDDAILFDYDPDQDQAVCTYDRDGERNEVVLNRYAETLPKNPLIHPDEREKLLEVLKGEDRNGLEMDFRGDCYRIGKYEQFHVSIYYYGRREHHRRTLAVIKKKAASLA